MKALQFSGVIETIRSKKDRSLGLSISTPELSVDERSMFIEYQGLVSKIIVQPMEEEADGVLEVEKHMEGKTPSQRLRATLFVLWKQKGEKGLFENFYRIAMEAAINKVKDQLEGDTYDY